VPKFGLPEPSRNEKPVSNKKKGQVSEIEKKREWNKSLMWKQLWYDFNTIINYYEYVFPKQSQQSNLPPGFVPFSKVH